MQTIFYTVHSQSNLGVLCKQPEGCIGLKFTLDRDINDLYLQSMVDVVVGKKIDYATYTRCDCFLFEDKSYDCRTLNKVRTQRNGIYDFS